MPTESVDQLIEQLKKLKVQESTILEKLSWAREQEKEAQKERPRSTKVRSGRHNVNQQHGQGTFQTTLCERTRQNSDSTIYEVDIHEVEQRPGASLYTN
jgi:hypothetical protein